MTVEFRAGADVTNATATTSVTVTKPTGTANDDVLVAFIAEIGVGSITAPAGWTLIGSQASGTDLTVAAYYKVAASEGASWTWTLGASVSNEGWVGAFTGVDTSAPIAASAPVEGVLTVLADDVIFRPHGMLVQCGAAVGTATGAQLTMQSNLKTGLIDVSGQAPAADYITIQSTLGTNKGAGTDLALTAATYEAPWNIDRRGKDWGDRWLSTTTTGRVAWNISLEPALVAAFDGELPTKTVEAAFGGDPDDPDSWSWSAVTSEVMHEYGITITSGRTSEGSSAQPTSIELTFKSQTGLWHPDNPFSSHWPYVKRGLPLRVTVPYGYAPTSLRGLAFARSYQPQWDTSGNWSEVGAEAVGRLARIRRDPALKSPLFRSMSGTTDGDAVPHEYWPMEDGSSASHFGSALTGRQPMTVTGDVSFGADSSHPGSEALPTFGLDALAVGPVTTYADTGFWVVQWTMKIPEEPLSDTFYAEFLSTGAAKTWRIYIEPSPPVIVTLRIYDAAGNLISGLGTVVGDTFFDSWASYIVGCEDDGGGNYVAWFGMTQTDAFPGASGSLHAGASGTVTHVKPLAGNGSAHGHYGVFVDPAFTIGVSGLDGIAQNAAAALGWGGEYHPDRHLRVNREQRIPAAISHLSPSPYTADAMGVQRSQTISDIYGDIEGVNSGGFIHDARGPQGEVILDPRAGRYNQVVAMTVDVAQAQIKPPYGPQLDDQRLRTTSTVTRQGGSSGTYTNDIGEGEYDDPVTINLYDDDQPAQWAAWRVALGTAPGVRYPQITIDLRANPELVPAFCDLRIGDRIRLTNPPSQQHPDDVDLIVEGMTERIAADSWTATLHCSPYAPYAVGSYGPDLGGTVACYGPGTTTIAAAVDNVDTSWLFNAGIDTWPTAVTHPSLFPFNIKVGGLTYSCSAIGSPVVANFGTPAVNSWSPADTGQAWSLFGAGGGVTTSQWNVAGGVGTHLVPAANASRASYLAALSLADVEVLVTVTLPVSDITGGSVEPANLLLRGTSISSFYTARVEITTAEAVIARLYNPSGTLLASATIPNLVHSSSQALRVRASLKGTTFAMKVWPASGAEPRPWHVTATDATAPGPGWVGVSSGLASGNTNAPLTFSYDNFEIVYPYQATVTRLPVDKSHAAGSAVTLPNTAIYSL